MGLPSKAANRYSPSRQLISGEDVNNLSDQLNSSEILVAKAGGTKAAATQINAANVLVSTVASAADSLLLPTPFPGLTVTIVNSGANSLQLFGRGTDTIDGAATGTGIAIAAGAKVIVKCIVGRTALAPAAQWFSFLSA